MSEERQATETTQTETSEVTTTAAPVETKPSPVADWKDREMERLRGQRRARDSEIQELKARLTEYEVKQQTSQATQTQTLDPTADFDRRVAEAVRQQVAAQNAQNAANDFARRCNEAVAQGQEKFGKEEFDRHVNGLKSVTDFTDAEAAGRFNNLLIAALETGKAPDIINFLGENPDEASRLLGLPQTKMTIEIARLAGPDDQPQVSRAPAPIRPVTQTNSNRSPISPDDADRADQLTTSEWMRRRESQLNERYGGTRRFQ